MHDLSSALGHANPVIRDPTLGAYRRRYFVQTDQARRAFSNAGATRIARRTRCTWRATLKHKWNLAIEREEAHRRAVGI